ncbi:hypothetical protein FTM89_03280 [Chlamydia trachomatis]|uniref:Uncharacterized protein n=1 Tax=Chlamydia muridarum TaxID=83560 RepID=A0A070A165_CHLMR|nr:hypothetical protein [Chlamydia muridarum]UFT43420.1 hypothetical protein FTN46_03300 [Chlamydia trachomatis]AHH23003.1 hypothetical protein TAC_03245 [Chlamydia muridarum str. Nigg3 CMUT3-5]AHH23928.1 hypothetical protein Y015_03245 [Chlamydia muridarum str. Nigg CM972]AID38135.1 hypothetical protein BB17_03295 [Chlamydia muridarum str. Nigg 2 MCR]AIT90789.1 hypothetical protein NC80_03105 [Chlamydia muridarum]
MQWYKDDLTSAFSKQQAEVFSLEQMRRTLTWEEIATKVPQLPRGWFELVGLSRSDRIELFQDFWFSALGVENSDFPGICHFFPL